jgi:hypothetical protein
MNFSQACLSVVVGFLGGSMIKAVTGPVITVPNFTQAETKTPSKRLVFMPKEINGKTHYVLSRVEDGSVPYLSPEQVVEAHNNGPIDGRTLKEDTPKPPKKSPIEGISLGDWNDLLEAIRIVESNNNPDAVGDNGNAIGVYQIWEDYHTDACMAGNIGGDYLDCYDPVYATSVVVEYMKRYAIERRIGKVTPEKIARIHNGGPNGYKWSATDKYWAKVKPVFERLQSER